MNIKQKLTHEIVFRLDLSVPENIQQLIRPRGKVMQGRFTTLRLSARADLAAKTLEFRMAAVFYERVKKDGTVSEKGGNFASKWRGSGINAPYWAAKTPDTDELMVKLNAWVDLVEEEFREKVSAQFKELVG